MRVRGARVRAIPAQGRAARYEEGCTHEGHGHLERGRLDRGDRRGGAVRGAGDRRAHRSAQERRGRRPSARAVRAVLRRDVGALQLLRDARAAGAVPDQALAVRRRQGDAGLWRLRGAGLYHPRPRRRARGSLARPAQGGAVRRHPAGGGPRAHGSRRQRRAERPHDQRVLGGARLHHRGLGLPQGEHLGDRRPALQDVRRAARCGLHDLLHGGERRRGAGHDPRRLSRRNDRLGLRLRACRNRHGHRPHHLRVRQARLARPRRGSGTARSRAAK